MSQRVTALGPAGTRESIVATAERRRKRGLEPVGDGDGEL